MTYDPRWVRDTAVVKRDGTNALTGDWDIGNQRSIILEELQMRDASGLTISDTTANILVSLDNQTGLFSLRQGTGIHKFSTDTTLSGNSDNVVPTEKAIKSYVDNSVISDWQLISEDSAATTGDRLLVNTDTTSSIYAAPDGTSVNFSHSGSYTPPDGDAVNFEYVIDATSVTIILPASPAMGDEIDIVDAGINFGTKYCIIARNGKNIDGIAEDYVLDSDKQDVRLVYVTDSVGWRVIT